MTASAREHVLTLDCEERPGIVSAVSGFLAERDFDILDIVQFGDRRGGHFYMRVQFETPTTVDASDLADGFAPVAERFGMTWRVRPAWQRTRVLIMVSRFGHCLNDLLFRARIGELPIEIVAVVSNHEDHRGLVEWHVENSTRASRKAAAGRASRR